MARVLVLVLAVLMATVLLADVVLSQTFSYSRGWKNGKRGGPAVNAVRPPVDEQAVDELYRILMKTRGTEHRVAYDPWHFVVDPLPLPSEHEQEQR